MGTRILEKAKESARARERERVREREREREREKKKNICVEFRILYPEGLVL